MSASRRIIAMVLATALADGALTACSAEEGPGPTLSAFVAGWPTGGLHDVPFVEPSGHKVPADEVAAQIKQLSGDVGKQPATVRVTGEPQVVADVATGELTVAQPLPGERVWEYTTQVRLSKAKDGWRIIWEPKIVHPQLLAGDQLAMERISPVRAGVLDGSGAALVAPRPVVTVGIHPSKVTDLDGLVKELADVFKSAKVDVDTGGLAATVEKAGSDQFVEVVTLRREVYDPIRDRLQALAGTTFREGEQMLAPTRGFARALLGFVGPVTKEIMDANPGAYQIGDHAGLAGLQREYDERLRGASGLKIVIARKAPDGSVHKTTVHTFPAAEGRPLKTTLDPKTQNAADKALTGVDRGGALVAIRISDGTLLAVANSGPENLAFTAQVPPGSTFKTITALALLDSGNLTNDTIVDCPRYITVEGHRFKNAGAKSYELGPVPFQTDFARSCNTAFISLAPQLGPDGLAKAGAMVGIGQEWDLGTPVFTGKVSTGGGATEQAAAAFGQGTTVVSPVALAAAAAAVARGQWKQPVLLLDPQPGKPAPDGQPLKPEAVRQLREMMREVVVAGTSTELKSVPGGPVFGKSGTAEYDGDPAHTHRWFIGWQGDIAFAVFVQGGGQKTAAPSGLVRDLLSTLAK